MNLHSRHGAWAGPWAAVVRRVRAGWCLRWGNPTLLLEPVERGRAVNRRRGLLEDRVVDRGLVVGAAQHLRAGQRAGRVGQRVVEDAHGGVRFSRPGRGSGR